MKLAILSLCALGLAGTAAGQPPSVDWSKPVIVDAPIIDGPIVQPRYEVIPIEIMVVDSLGTPKPALAHTPPPVPCDEPVARAPSTPTTPKPKPCPAPPR